MASDATPSVERLLSESVWLTSLAKSLLGSDEAAVDDVVQEARLAALRSAPADPGHARAWLARVTRNFALRVRLRRARRERRERAAAVPEAQPSTLELVARVNAQRRVAAAVVALDEPYRSVVLLRWFDALPVKDVAERLGVPVETVRTRLKRALAKLRAELDSGFGSRDAWAALLLPWSGPVGGAGTSMAAATKAATGAGAATVVGAGVVTMSFATKSMIAAACVVAAAVAWRLLPERLRSGSTNTTPRVSGGSDLVAARGAEANAADSSRRPESADATRSAEPTTTDAKTADSPARKSVRVTATIVSSLDDRPVANAELRITTIRWSPSKVEETMLASVRADAEGRVAATVAVEPELHPNWEVFAEGFVPGGGWNLDASPAGRSLQDLGTVRLVRGSRVSGRVVRAPDLMPVAGAELRVDSFPFVTGALSRIEILRSAATSAADGSFALRQRVSAPSKYLVPILALCEEGLAIGTFRIPDAAEEVGGVEVVLGVPARLTVSIRDDVGAPIEGARVCCMPRFAPFKTPQMRDGIQEFLTFHDPRLTSIFDAGSDSAGVALFAKLPTAPVAPIVEPLDAAATRYTVAATAEGHEYGSVHDVRVEAGAPATCTVVLPRTRFVSVVGKVTAPDGEPIPDASVEASENPSSVRATTDEKGEFRLDRLPTTWRSVYLQVSAPGRKKFQEGFEFTSLAAVPLLDDHGAPIEARHVDVVLERTARLSGRVVDEAGVPIAGARIHYSRGLNGMAVPGPVEVETPGTDEQGRFDHEVTEAEWIVVAWAPLGDGTFGPSVTRAVKGGATDLLLICPTKPVRAAKVTCEVVDAASGAPAPVASADVQVAEGFRGDWNVWKTISLGRVVASGFFAGRWRIDLELSDHRRASREFDVANDRDEVRLRVEVGAPARVVGRVEPVPADLVTGRFPPKLDWNPSDARLVDADGRVLTLAEPPQFDLSAARTFILDGFVPGQTARVRFTDFGAIFDEVVFTPENGEVREIVLRPRASAHVAWKSSLDVSKGWLMVDLAFGEEPWRNEFFLVDRDPGASEPAHTIRPGHYRWRALFQPDSHGDVAPQITTASGEFEVAAGATHELRIDELH